MENTAQQNLDLIAQMMKSAQNRFYNDSPYYILWGAAVAIASLLQYVLLLNDNPKNGIGWAIVIPIAVIAQLVIVKKQKKESQSKTMVEQILVSMWMAFGVSIFIVLLFSAKLELNTYPVLLCFYALTTFVSGTAFKIKSFIWGAIASWIFAIVSFFVTFDVQLLLLAAGALGAFVIPGIVLRTSEKAESK